MIPECKGPRPEITPVSFPVPTGACDCHVHIFGPFQRFPMADDRSYTPPENPVESLIRFHNQLGIDRAVIVQPTPYGTDNALLLDALERFPQRFRGVAVLPGETSERELDRMHDLGVRGIRINLMRLHGAQAYRNGVGLNALVTLAPKLKERGWHAQLFIAVRDIPEIEEELRKLPVEIVIDHMARPNVVRDREAPGYDFLCRMLMEERFWCKLSAADRNTSEGPPYTDVDPIAQRLIEANDRRVIWGSDWPHVGFFDKEPADDGVLLSLVGRWAPDAERRDRILVSNAARLYQFPAADGDGA